MNTAASILGGSAAGVIVTAIVSYLIAHRTTSGTIRTSQASDLWAEGRAQREMLIDTIKRLESQRDSLIDMQRRAIMPLLQSMQEMLFGITVALAAMQERLDELAPPPPPAAIQPRPRREGPRNR